MWRPSTGFHWRASHLSCSSRIWVNFLLLTTQTTRKQHVDQLLMTFTLAQVSWRCHSSSSPRLPRSRLRTSSTQSTWDSHGCSRFSRCRFARWQIYLALKSHYKFLPFPSTQFLPSSIAVLGIYGTMFIMASLCFVGAVFIIVYVPETKNQSMEEIQEMMAKWISRRRLSPLLSCWNYR